MKRPFGVFLLMLVCAAPATAQVAGDPDAEGCKDSKLLTRMPGCTITACTSKEFDAVEFQVKPVNSATGDVPKQALEGQVETLDYICSTKLSPLQLHRNFETALKAAGFTIVMSGKDENEWQIVTAKKASQWVQVVSKASSEGSAYTQSAVKVQENRQEVAADASVLEAEITKSGSVAVYGINFETGKATLQPGSEQVLAEIAKLMKERTDWRFEVQGHTDNVGQKAANMTLSDQRAKAVAAWLTKSGIDASRLVPKGYGDTAPVADNTSDEGRAKNRRVELKKLNEE